MALGAQLAGEGAQALGRPAQRQPRIAAAVAINQPLEIGKQRRVLLRQPLASSAWPADAAALKRLSTRKLAATATDRRAGDPGGAMDHRYPAPAMRVGLGRGPQPHPPLIELPREQLELPRDRLLVGHRR